MSLQGKLIMGNKTGRNKTTKYAFRDALKSAGLFSNVNERVAAEQAELPERVG